MTAGKYSPVFARILVGWPLLLVGAASFLLPSPVGWAVGPVACVCAIVRTARVGIFFDRNDVVIRNAFRTFRLRWRDVDAIEPSLPTRSELLVFVAGDRRLQATITIGPGRRGREFVDALEAVLGPRQASRVIRFRLPAHPKSIWRGRASWRALKAEHREG